MNLRQTIDRELRLWLIMAAVQIPVWMAAWWFDWPWWFAWPLAIAVGIGAGRHFDPPEQRRQRQAERRQGRCQGDHEFMARAAAEHGTACGAVRATCGGCEMVLWERDA